MKCFIFPSAIANERLLPWLGAFAGAILAVWVIFQSYGIINTDGILYIEVAKQFDAGAWRKGFALYNWPFYPLLIAATHQVSGLGFQASAQMLTVIFFALASAGIVTLAREAGGNRCVMLAAGLLLLCSPYIVRSILPMIIRDHGFLASHIWSIVFFLRFYRNNAWNNAGKWGATAILATLFRIEGIIYLVMLPLVFLAQNIHGWRTRIALMLKAHTLPIFAAAVLAGVSLFYTTFSMRNLGRLRDPANVVCNAWFQLTQGFSGKLDIYAENVLGTFLDDYALPGLLLTLAFVLLSKAAASAGWLQLACAVYSRTSARKSAAPNPGIVFGWLLLIGLVNAIFIILSAFLLSTRYVLPIAVIILIYAAFGLSALFAAWQRKPKRPIAGNWLFPAAIAAIMLQMTAILWPANSANGFEQDAVRWIRMHAPADSKIYYDHDRLRYYATGNSETRKETTWTELQQLIAADQLRQYDYVLVHVSKKYPEQQQFLTENIGAPPLALFENRHNKQVLIYKVP